MKRLLFIALTLQGCAAFGVVTCPTTDPSSSAPPVSVRDMRATWEARFGLMPPACDTPWFWDVVSTSDQWRLCGTRKDAACTLYPSGCPVTYVTAVDAGDRTLAAHEWAHWAGKCSHGDSDTNHTNPDIWGAGGFIHSFER
jgi:hypothetical protein